METMTELESIMKALEIQDKEDFLYFDTFCLLMEYENEVCEDTWMDIYINTDMMQIGEMLDDYLEEAMTGIPDDCMDVYELFSRYKSSCKNLIRHAIADGNMGICIEEICRFRQWYVYQKSVVCISLQTNETFTTNLLQAFILARLEKLAQEKYKFDFTQALDFEYLHYEDEMEDWLDEEDELEDEQTSETLIDRDNPLIDGEYYDQPDEEMEGEPWEQ